MPNAITICVFALAVARVTRFITSDKLSEGPRAWLVDRAWRRWRPVVPLTERPYADEPKPAYLLTCAWCASIYVAAVAAPICWAWGDSPYALLPALACAFSYAAGLFAQLSGVLEKIGE
jgi:hypothetical protein